MRSREFKNDVDDVRLASCDDLEPAFLEHLQHRSIFRQDMCHQLLEPAGMGNDCEMPQQGRADAESLVGVVDREGYFGLAGLDYNVSCAADEDRLSVHLQ